MKNYYIILVCILILISVLLFLNFKSDAKMTKENFVSNKNKEDIQAILNTEGISYSDKISKIKNLQIKDDTLNDLIFNNEKIVIKLIKEYIETDTTPKS
jgi:hypothetical protein